MPPTDATPPIVAALGAADLPACAALLIDAYNGPPWDQHWAPDSALRYLAELHAMPRFVGWVLRAGDDLLACAFAHERTWWNADELYIDELYVARAGQRQGHGGRLLEAIEGHCRERGLAGVTLLTNRFMPAVPFYERHGYTAGEHVLFMYKVLER
jgi:GNAT superfamily N-acetyltransferase